MCMAAYCNSPEDGIRKDSFAFSWFGGLGHSKGYIQSLRRRSLPCAASKNRSAPYHAYTALAGVLPTASSGIDGVVSSKVGTNRCEAPSIWKTSIITLSISYFLVGLGFQTDVSA